MAGARADAFRRISDTEPLPGDAVRRRTPHNPRIAGRLAEDGKPGEKAKWVRVDRDAAAELFDVRCKLPYEVYRFQLPAKQREIERFWNEGMRGNPLQRFRIVLDSRKDGDLEVWPHLACSRADITVLRKGYGNGNAVLNTRYVDFGVSGDALREGEGDGRAENIGPGDGDARRSGAGNGDARRGGSGNGHAMRAGKGKGSAVKFGDGDGAAERYGPGDGDAFMEGAGNGKSVRSGTGRGESIRRGAGNGDAWHHAQGPGEPQRYGEGEGHAFYYEDENEPWAEEQAHEEAAASDAVRYERHQRAEAEKAWQAQPS